MKNNMPVTETEHHMEEGSILVSKTDLKGTITYANAEFVRISGFTEQELLGQSHNIVRHPDMPPEAFDDLWKTVKAGRGWSGIVKNRCKNGDYYWVYANVIPIVDQGRVVEFMSVRTKPSRRQIAEAEKLYQSVRENKASLQPGGLARLGVALDALSLKRTMRVGGLLNIAVLGGCAALLMAGQAPELVAWVLGVSGVLTLAFVFWLGGRIFSPLEYARTKLDQVLQGQYFDWTETDRTDEVGLLLRTIKSVQVRLGFDVMDAREKATSALRIQAALDHASTNVMMADQNDRIIYMNLAVEKMFRSAESDLRAVIPGFDANTLMGANIDVFHKAPEHQRRILERLSGTHVSQLAVGGRHFQIIANPVTDASGQRLGTVVEWADRTAEVFAQQQIQDLMGGARNGDFSKRIDVSGKTGFEKILGDGLNQIAEDTDLTFKDFGRVIQGMANGDLTRQTAYADYQGVYGSFRANLIATQTKLSEVFEQIREAADFIYNSSQEIAAGNNNLSQRAEEQASSLEETASSMEELTGTVKNNADNANQANQVATSARQLATRGGDVVHRTVAAMGEINASSSKIANIIGTIDEIAFQTNLLALNASVEAARAGEQGRGFAVVATEVRNLAQRSAKAAKESRELIQNSQEKVQAGSSLVTESGRMLEEIVSSVQKVGDLVSEITAASREQADGIQQVNLAVSQMDEITQQNAALAEEASAASVSMCEQAHNMVQLLAFFKTSGDGRHSTEHPPKGRGKPGKSGGGGGAGIDFSIAKGKHLAWKARIGDFLAGRETLTLAQAVSPRDCDLGKWLYGEGMKQYGYLPEMDELEKQHAEMHGLVKSIIGSKERGDTGRAQSDFQRMQRLSDQVVHLLARIEGRVTGNPPSAPRNMAPPKPAFGGQGDDEWEEF